MLVLGVDPGTAITGYGLVSDDGGKLTCVRQGCILTRAGLPLQVRLASIFDKLSAVLDEEKPDCASVEQLFFNSNAKSALAVGHARGVVLLACEKAHVEVAEYTPLQVKLAVSGYGRADKKQMQSMVKILLGLDKIPTPDDTADALAMAICHLNTAPQLTRLPTEGDNR